MENFAPRYVELQTAFKKGDNEFEYNKTVKANENFINQNFQALSEEIVALKAIIKILQGGT